MKVSWEEQYLFDPPPTTESEISQGDAVQKVFDHWVATLRNSGKGVIPKLSDERKRKIGKAVDLYGVDVCIAAIDGCSKSAFHMGNNGRGKRYDDILLILRDAKHIEMFADMADSLDPEAAFLQDES